MAVSKRLPKRFLSNNTPVVKRIATLKILAWAFLACTLVWVSIVLKSNVEIDEARIIDRARPQWQRDFIERVQHPGKESFELDLDVGRRDWREIEERLHGLIAA